MRLPGEPLELVQGYAPVAVHERHDGVPALSVIKHKAFHDLVLGQSELEGGVPRASPRDKSIVQTPHVLPCRFQNTQGWSLSPHVHFFLRIHDACPCRPPLTPDADTRHPIFCRLIFVDYV